MATVIGLFEEFSSAHRAVRDLLNQKIDQDNISVIASNAGDRASTYIDEQRALVSENNPEENAGVGASIGAVLGGMGGLLAGLGALVIPVVGPILAAGPIAAALGGLAGAGMGALAGGAAGELIRVLEEAGIPADAAGLYARGLQRGGTLVVVRVPEDNEDLVREIIESHDPIDVAKQNAEEGDPVSSILDPDVHTTEYDPDYREELLASPFTQEVPAEQFQPGQLYGYSQAISMRFGGLSWEQARQELENDWNSHGYGPWIAFQDAIQKGYHQGHQRAIKELEPFEPEFRQHFEHMNTSGNQEYEQFQPSYAFGWLNGLQAEAPDARWEDVLEELQSIRQARYGESWEQYEPAVRFGWELRRRAENPQNGNARQPMNGSKTDFQAHFKEFPPAENRSFHDIQSAYLFGAELARHPEFADARWDRIEDQVRAEWEVDHEEDWDLVGKYVRYGWQKAREKSGQREDEK